MYLCHVFVSLYFLINLSCLLKLGLKVENIWIIKSGLGSWHLLGYCSVLNKMHFQLSQFSSCCTTCISLNRSRIDQIGIRLRLGFINLCEHKFRHNFHDTLNPLCSCSIDPETTLHYFSVLPQHFFHLFSSYEWS